MVLDSLFKLQELAASESELKATLAIAAAHRIFDGHFPGQPVVPGVCMIQLVKELVERQTNRKYIFSEADNIKFLSVIDPRVNPSLEADISFVEKDSEVVVNASLFAGSVTFFKLKGLLKLSK